MVPIAYVGNMVNSGKNFQRETLATHETEGQSCVSHQTTRPKTPKWTKIAREASANNTTIMGRIEIGKKKKITSRGSTRWVQEKIKGSGKRN